MTEYINQSYITSDEGILKKVIKSGAGSKPQVGEEVCVKFEGKLEDGTVFDSSHDYDEEMKFRIGEGALIDGLEKAITEM